jgi:hypothetical protein
MSFAHGRRRFRCRLVPLTCRHARENLPDRAAKRQSYVPAHQRRDARCVLPRRGVRVGTLARTKPAR